MTTQDLEHTATQLVELIDKLKTAIDEDDSAAAEVAVEEAAQLADLLVAGIGRLTPDQPAPGEPNTTQQND